MPIYLNALKQFGFDTSLIPAKLHVAIMEESERDSLSGGDWDGLTKTLARCIVCGQLTASLHEAAVWCGVVGGGQSAGSAMAQGNNAS